MMPDHAEIYANGKYLGTSRTLIDIATLNYESSQRMAVRKAAKSISRIALKGAAAIAASSENKDLGNLLWMWALASETEDTRRWETLPARLAVARVPCPDNPTYVEIVFKSYADTTVKRLILTQPLMKKDRLYVVICRDWP